MNPFDKFFIAGLLLIFQVHQSYSTLTTEISSLVNPTFFQYMTYTTYPELTWFLGTGNVGYGIFRDQAGLCNDMTAISKIRTCLNGLSQLVVNHTFTFNTTNYIGAFTSGFYIRFNTQRTDKYALSYWKQIGSFKLILFGTALKPDLIADNIYLYQSTDITLNFTNEINNRIPVNITQINKNIRRNGHLRTDTFVGDEYQIEFTRILDFAQNNYTYARENLVLFLSLKIDGKADSWGVNNFVVKNDVSKEQSCLIPKSQTTCYSCPINMVLNSKGVCQCISGYERALHYFDFYSVFKIHGDPKYKHLQQFQCISTQEKNFLQTEWKMDIPSLSMQRLAHYFLNSQNFVQVYQEQNGDVSFLVTIETLTQISPSSLDLSEVLFNLVVRPYKEYNAGARFIQNDDALFAKYNQRFLGDNVSQYNNFQDNFQWDETFNNNYQWFLFTKGYIEFSWIDISHLKITVPLIHPSFCSGKELMFFLSFWMMGNKGLYVRINPYNNQEFRYTCTNGEIQFFHCESAVDENDYKTKNQINLVMEGTFNGMINGQAFLCEILTCTRPQEIFSIRFKGLNYMKIFITDPSFQGLISIDEISYKAEQDNLTRLFVQQKTLIYPFRQNQVIVGFITNSLIFPDDVINIYVQVRYTPVDSTTGQLMQTSNPLQTIQIRNVPVLDEPVQIEYDI